MTPPAPSGSPRAEPASDVAEPELDVEGADLAEPSAKAPETAQSGCPFGDALHCEKPECGSPPENPHGYKRPPVKRDGSCKVRCQPPRPLPPCQSVRGAQPLSLAALQQSVGKLARIRGLLGFYPVWCTKRGGPCACNNGCWAYLRLVRSPDDWWSDPEVAARNGLLQLAVGAANADAGLADYRTPEGELVCHGDEGSVCCPFALDHESNSAPVIVSGRVEPAPNEPGAYQITVQSLCRVPR